MYVISTLETAVEMCNKDSDSEDSVHTLDKAVAYYTGSTQQVGNTGFMFYSVAERFCQGFGTCSETGESKANENIFHKFRIMQGGLLEGDCDYASIAQISIEEQMYVPVVQGLLHYAYQQASGRSDSITNAVGAMYAAAFLPMVHADDPENAKILYDNMKVGSETVDFAAVKKAVEESYGIVGLRCADVGMFWDVSEFEPCVDVVADDDEVESSNTLSTKSQTISVVVGVFSYLVTAVVYFLVRCCVLCACRKRRSTAKLASDAAQEFGEEQQMEEEVEIQAHSHTLD